MGNPPKIGNLKKAIREKLEAGQDRYVDHAKERLNERDVNVQEVEEVLNNGYHEKKKDEFKSEYGSWNYAIQGKTTDGRKLRIIVSFDGPYMSIITVINLDK